MDKDSLLIRRVAAAGVVSLPWALFVVSWLVSPGYIGPFVHHPLGISLTLFGVVVGALCWWLLQRSSSIGVWVCVIFFGVVPQFLIPMLGPAIITIMQALGPVFAK